MSIKGIWHESKLDAYSATKFKVEIFQDYVGSLTANYENHVIELATS
jgi:hypothetical protein